MASNAEGASVSHDAFSILGITPMLGRGLRPEEESPAAELVVLLSHSLWQRRFGGDRGVLGERVTLGETPATVVGVLPPDTIFPLISDPEIFVPLRIDHSSSCGRGCVNLRVVARLGPGVGLDRARGDMEAVARRGDVLRSTVGQGVLLLGLGSAAGSRSGLLPLPLSREHALRRLAHGPLVVPHGFRRARRRRDPGLVTCLPGERHGSTPSWS